MQIKTYLLIMTSSSRHQYPYDTLSGVVINRVKFYVCTAGNFDGVEEIRKEKIFA